MQQAQQPATLFLNEIEQILRDDDAVFSHALGFIHGIVGALEKASESDIRSASYGKPYAYLGVTRD